MKTCLPEHLNRSIKRLLLAVTLALLAIANINAQSIAITGLSGLPVCAGSQITITFSTINGNGTNRYSNSTTYFIYLSNSTGSGFSQLSTFQTTGITYSGSNGGTTSNITTTITIPANSVAGSGYRLSMGSTSPNYNRTSPFSLNQSAAFTINTRPTGALSGTTSICNGSSTNLSLAVSGPGTISGILSNGAAFSGSAPAITVSVSPAVTTSYSIVSLSNGNCSAIAADISGTATVTVKARPTATISGSTSICNGSTANLLLTVTGTGTNSGTLSNGMPFSGTAPSINVAISPSSTSTYTVATLNDAGCSAIAADLSGSATINVYQLNSITTQPATTQTVCSGTPATFNVQASGSGTFSYQWYKGSSPLSNGGRFSGVNTNTLVINPVAASDAATDYNVIITAGPCAPLTSNNSALVVNQEIFITSQPEPTQNICQESVASLSATATGTGPFVAQWFKGATPINTGVITNGDATTVTTTLTINPVSASDGGSYYIVFTSSTSICTSEYSDNSILNINLKSADPISASASVPVICVGQNTILSLSGGGGGTLETIRWYTSSCGENLTGSGNNLSVSPLVTTTYFGRYEDAAPCGYNSGCVQVTVTVQQISADPTSAAASVPVICIGQNTNLSIAGGGSGTAEVIRWYTASCGGTLAGSGNNLSVSPAVTTTYYGRYENAAPCSYVSGCVAVTVTVTQRSTSPVSAVASPATICIGGSATLSLNGGTPVLGTVIRWYTSSCGGTMVGSGNGISVSPSATTTYYGRYEDQSPCIYNTACAQVTLTVTQLPSVNAGTTISLCGDANQANPTGAVSINISAGATASNYSSVLWSTSGSGTFTNATSLSLASYTPSPADKTAGNVTLTLKAFGNAPCGMSTSTKTLTLGKTIINVVKLSSVCSAGNTAIVTIDQGSPALIGGNGVYSYQWEFSNPGNSNFLPIAGETSSSLVVTQSNNNGFYRRVVRSGGCTSYSNHVHVNANFVISSSSFTMTGGGSYCGNSGSGVPVGLSGSINGLPEFFVTYRLLRNGVYTGTSIVGTGSALNFPNQTLAGTYTVDAIVSVVNGGSCSPMLISGGVTVTIDAPVPVVNAGSNQSLCNQLSADLTGSDPSPYTGKWTLLSGTGTIANPTSLSTTVSGLSIGDNVFKWKVSNITCADSATVTVHVEPAFALTSQPVETIFCVDGNASMSVSASGTNPGYQWMESTDNGASYHAISNNAIFNGTNTNTLSFTALPITMSGYLYKAIATVAAPCNASVASNGVLLLVRNLWKGSTGNDWFTPGNWSGNTVPNNTCPDVYIPGGTPNQPLLTAGIASVRNIMIKAGAILTVDNATIQVSGNIDNTGSFIAGNGTVDFIGSSGQQIATNTFENNALKNLIVSTSGSLILGGALDVYGKLSFTGTGKTLVTNDNLTLKSTAGSTAYVAEIPVNSSGVAQDVITGEVMVECFIPAAKAWRFLSIPTNSTQTIHQSWQEDQTANSTSLSGFGFHITSNRSTWASEGFDVQTPGGPSVKTYNSTTGGYDGITSTFNPIKFSGGYMCFIRGDRTVNMFNQAPTTTILRTKGELYTGTQPVINVPAGLFSAIGNPFASAIDFSKVEKTGGIQDVFYMWDPNLSFGYGYGAFQTFIGPGPEY
ncbi:MAG: hypothetical protein ABIO04_06160, partial [Ferruginibacter sp.]